MVWGAFRATNLAHHDAEDAFQATFLVLVRKAASIRSPELLPNWLHRVACQTARKARQRAAKRYAREKQVRAMPEPTMEPHDDGCGPELRALLDEELSRLPEKYRIAVVLCDVEGRTRHDAAQQLRLPEGTVASRLARGRALLARRLIKRGLSVSATSLAATGLQQAASGAVPAALLTHTIKAVNLPAAGGAVAAGLISPEVAALTDSVLRATSLAKLKTALLVLLLVGLVPSGGLLAHHILAGREAPSARADDAGSVCPINPVSTTSLPSPRLPDPPWPLPDEAVGVVRSFKAPTSSKGVAVAAVAAFLPDGRAERSWAEMTGSLRLYEGSPSGEQLWAFDCHAVALDGVRDVAISPDGRLALVAVQDCTVRLLDMATGNELRRFEGHKARCLGVSFSKNGRFALTACGTWDSRAEQDNTVRIWDVASGKEIRRFEGHTGWVSTPVFSPDERFVLSPSNDRTIRLWDVETGKEVRRFVGHTGFIRTAVFSRDGRLILSSSEDSTLRLWDVATAKEIRVLHRPSGNYGGHAVLSPDGRRAS